MLGVDLHIRWRPPKLAGTGVLQTGAGAGGEELFAPRESGRQCELQDPLCLLLTLARRARRSTSYQACCLSRQGCVT